MVKASQHYFYVLYCSDGSYYGGYTTDVLRREAEHNAGIRCKYTQTRRPVRVVYFEKYETRSEAMRAEAVFKQKSRRQKDVFLKKQANFMGGNK